ncbi:glycine--tRNA ligase [Candidatus Gottesmanbacteria bacterium RBG_16_52_11]|uniref:glycine--tRNA ligase n=1 Tax=Candidatus Gottesmanbacteria bacterium RBG_16_52_11 TaxID=1798374 RepID=A0A1F5YUJ8_9BACT|nr:MAG: glycine--tRNA ligase [Candidatus Gottesmanbacteria bacterium RBG_16_52_11]
MKTIDAIVALAKRRGFVYPSSELYGGLGGFYDYGPLGVALVRSIKDSWWKTIVDLRDDIVGLDSCIILNPEVWRASGHVASFTDPLTECKVCHMRIRADQPVDVAAHEAMHRKAGIKTVEWTEARQFNLLFRSFVGPVEDSTSQVYLRGETCQGIFINFPNVLATTRVRIPFGIAQIGKAFRNEVTPGKYLFRVREFEQMELEYFVHPDQAGEMLAYWKNERFRWHLEMGLGRERLRFRQHEADERAHYAADSWDIEYDFPEWGFREIEGIANRTDFDLKTHARHSGRDLRYRDSQSPDPYYPFVIEPSIGISRMFLALLADAYHEDGKRTVLRLKSGLAPYTAAVFPLVANKPELASQARDIYVRLKQLFRTAWDDRGNIGKRYLTQDEAGTPWCVTVDYQTLSDGSVTVRDRDTTSQERVSRDRLNEYFGAKLSISAK